MQAAEPVAPSGSVQRTDERRESQVGRAQSERVGWWSSVKDALAGSSQDFTEGSLGRAVLLLSIPMVLEMAMESIFGVLDAFWVGRLGPDAVAAVGVTEAMLTLVFAVALGLSLSTTATIARRIGEKNPEQAAVTAVQAMVVGLLVSVPAGLFAMLNARALLVLMGAPPSVVETGWTYTAWIVGGNITIFGLFLINAIFRGAGDASLAMRSLWVANAVNLVLDPCLIFGLGPFPAMGITGAAIGTTVGRAVGVAYQLRALAKGNGRIVVSRRHLRVDGTVMLRLLRLSMGGIVQFLIATASWVALVRIITPFGAAALAGYTIALRIIVVAILPAWGMCNAAATLVGQNLGAGKPERAERAVWLTGLYNMAFLGVVAVAFVLVAEPLIAIFSPDPAVRALGASALRIISYGYVFYAWGMVMTQAFNGAGDTTTPTWVNLCCYWLFQIPLAWTLARTLGLGPQGVYLAIAVAESTLATVSVLLFRRGRWKTRQV
jgi:putative MATE family efflux protein